MRSGPSFTVPSPLKNSPFCVTKEYSPPIVYEHGGSGNSVEHAHMHLVSTSVDLLNVLRSHNALGGSGTGQNLYPKRISNVGELKSWVDRGVAYIYYETRLGEAMGFPVVTPLESQFLRKRLAERLGMPNGTWDWMVWPRKQQVMTTWERLTNALRSNNGNGTRSRYDCEDSIAVGRKT